MKPLKIVFLWHQHQPYYKRDNEFILPWVRLHGVKDYFDLPRLMKDHAGIKQTINLAPSLMLQIDEYTSGKVKDRIQILSEIDAAELTFGQKEEILTKFFVCNTDHLIKPYSRFYQLFKKARKSRNDVKSFAEQDFRDLQVWYNLAWIGEYSRRQDRIASLFVKNNNFTEEDKMFVLDYHIEILQKIAPIMKELSQSGQIEISFSPEYHPIMPILIDHHSAQEAMPNLDLTGLLFKYPEDAKAQIDNGLKIYSDIFGKSPQGVWPSEGSISDGTLDMLAETGLLWTATDEQVLSETVGKEYFDLMKYFPHKYQKGDKKIKILFRDHYLSDRIGFVYSNWDSKQAADEFCGNLERIRDEIIGIYSEAALDYAAVTIILDGENCWEFYGENGVPFLNNLFNNLSQNEKFKTVTSSEAVEPFSNEYSGTFNHLQAGSWINANFSIWIGHQHDIIAWKMLAKVRNEVEIRSSGLPAELLNEIMKEIYIAEGSDWFWWYGPEHHAENKQDFDILFRYHIQRVYELLGMETPVDVFIPIGANEDFKKFEPARNKVSPFANGIIKEEPQWVGAAIFNTSGGMSTMHQIGELVSTLFVGNDDEHLFFRFNFYKLFGQEDSLYLSLNDVFSISIYTGGVEIMQSADNFDLAKYSLKETCDLSIKIRHGDKHPIKLKLKTVSNNNVIDYTEEEQILYYCV